MVENTILELKGRRWARRSLLHPQITSDTKHEKRREQKQNLKKDMHEMNGKRKSHPGMRPRKKSK